MQVIAGELEIEIADWTRLTLTSWGNMIEIVASTGTLVWPFAGLVWTPLGGTLPPAEEGVSGASGAGLAQAVSASAISAIWRP
jgi:hypothetical protein